MQSQPCYSARLMLPFARLLRTHPGMPEELIAPIENLDPDTRLPIATVHELLRGMVVMTGDEAVGLRATQHIEIGDYGALEYAAGTAQTGGEALSLIGRYMRLINDALTFSIEIAGDLAVVSLESAIVLPRAAEDFEVGAFYTAVSARTGGKLAYDFEVRFSHPQPQDTSLYSQVFSERATIRFDQPVCGFVFPCKGLEDPLPTADPKLHMVLRDHAERLVRELPQAQSVTARVRELLIENLASENATAAAVAKALHLSTSTLTRRLLHEGTTFKDVLDSLRRGLALRYLGQTDLALSEIAFLLGFSQTGAFHRAFKRWTDETPLGYRSKRRG